MFEWTWLKKVFLNYELSKHKLETQNSQKRRIPGNRLGMQSHILTCYRIKRENLQQRSVLNGGVGWGVGWGVGVGRDSVSASAIQTPLRVYSLECDVLKTQH